MTVPTFTLANASRFDSLVLVPIYLATAMEVRGLGIDAVLAPMAVSMIIVSPKAGRMADRGQCRAATTFGCWP